MSVNYRSGVGYGRSFRTAPNTGARGNAEYKDVLAAGKWLAAREDVDPARVGIWGLSYGGLLTAQALARNSDIFKAGVDLAGVHLEGSSLNPDDVSYKSSSISKIDDWKSPVLLIHGDDDRNVNFARPSASCSCCAPGISTTSSSCFPTTCTKPCCTAGGCTPSTGWSSFCTGFASESVRQLK